MKNIFKKGIYIVVGFLFLMLFSMTNVYAEGKEYTITIDPNGGIEGKDYQSVIVLSEDENYAVGGYNEDFLKAPEGKGFSGIEMIDKNGEVIDIADGVLLWGDEDHDGMVLKFHWGDLVSDVNLTLEYPEVGTETTTPTNEYGYYETDEQTNKPKVTVNSEYGFEIQYLEWVEKDSFVEEYEYYETPFIGTFEGGKKYYALVDLYCNSLDYAFSDSLNIKVNGQTANVYKVIPYSTSASITLEVELETTTYEVKEGANQTYTIGDNTEAKFRINADYSLFENGGKVFVDDKLVGPTNYTSEEGSTIIKLLQSYVDTLSNGTHTLKVVFNDDKTATTSFTVAKNTTDTTTEPTSNTNNQTVTNPPTGDNIVLYILVLGLSIIGLIGTGFHKKEKLFNK